MKFLTEDAALFCAHETGHVANLPSQGFVTVQGRRVLVAADPEGRTITGCTNTNPPVGIKPLHDDAARLRGLFVLHPHRRARRLSRYRHRADRRHAARRGDLFGAQSGADLCGWGGLMAVGTGAILFAHPDVRPDATGARSGLRFAPGGGLKLISGTESIRQALMILLTTVPGERIMHPDYGCDLYRLMFSPNDDTTAGLVIFYVRRAIERYERRVDIVALDASADANLPNQLDITLTYRVRETLRTDTLELPLRLEGG